MIVQPRPQSLAWSSVEELSQEGVKALQEPLVKVRSWPLVSERTTRCQESSSRRVKAMPVPSCEMQGKRTGRESSTMVRRSGCTGNANELRIETVPGNSEEVALHRDGGFEDAFCVRQDLLGLPGG